MKYSKRTLENGARLIFVPVPGARSVGVNVFVGTGSRFESVENNGISHFLEHLVFRGTNDFPDQKIISEAIEGEGGVLNGYTSESVTNYWCKVTPSHFARAFLVLSQMVSSPLLRPGDIESERGVILEEINRKEDNPQDKIFDNINQVTFPGHHLSYSVLGTARNIKSLKREDFENYRQLFYRPENLVVSVAGNVAESQVVSAFEAEFKSLKKNAAAPETVPFRAASRGARVFLENKKTEQAYFCLSFRGLNVSHPDRHKLFLLHSVLGSGMSSRLFLNIREKGLAYWVGSSCHLVAETGAWFVYAGFNVNRVSEALRAVVGELKKLKEELIGELEFGRAREKQKGPLLFQLEDPQELAEWYGSQEIVRGEIETEDKFVEKITSVQEAEARNLAGDLLRPENASLAIIGPYDSSRQKDFLDLLSF